MSARPYTLIPLTILGSALGLLLSLDGLYARLHGQFLVGSQGGPWWQPALQALTVAPPLDPYQVGWLPVVVGTAWFGALAGLWLNHRWGRHTVLALAMLSALHGGAFALLAAACLALALSASIRRWAEASPET